MNFLAIAVLALFLVLPGVTALFVPSSLISFSKRFLTSKGKIYAAGIRLVAGVILWFSASLSEDPELIEFFAILFIVGGLITLLIKLEVFERLLSWFFSWPQLGIRAWGMVAVAFGVWLISMY